MNDNFKILPSLKKSLPPGIQGYSTGFYSIALEAWRRGITVRFINNQKFKSTVRYELNSNGNKYTFVGSKGSLTSRECVLLTKRKHETKEILKQENVPTPNWILVENNISVKDIVEKVKHLTYPLVVKPIDGYQGKGVVSNIENEDELMNSINYVRDKLGYKQIMVEEHFEGEDLRVYVVDEEVVAITKRIPANVTGNGKDTIRTLIEKKNEVRKVNPILVSSPIKINVELKQHLEKQNLSLDSIPAENETIFLSSKNNISTGGDPVDITDEVSDHIKQIAVDAVKAMPDLPNAGVDLLVDFDKKEAVVIEINTQASIRSHLFPLTGEPRDVPKEIIDYYFPETKDKPKNMNIYFDFETIWQLFTKNRVKEYTLPTIPINNVQQKRFILTGQLYHVGFGSWVRKHARELNIHGHIKHLKNNQVEIVSLGDSKSLEQFKMYFFESDSEKFQISSIQEKEIKEQIMAGFRILTPKLDRKLKEGYCPVRIEGLSKLRRPNKKKVQKSSEKELIKAKKELEYYRRELDKVLQSRSWKLTRPLRAIGKLVKRLK